MNNSKKVILILLFLVFLIPPSFVYATEHVVNIPQGAHNRLCATFHNCYSPEEIKINVGDTITWPNNDSEPHSVTSGKPGAMDQKFDSGLYSPGESWSFTFMESGTFDYFCTIHPWMIGKVIVVSTQQNKDDQEDSLKIPEWIKINAGWWSSNQISDSDFAKGLEHLIKIRVIIIPQNTNSEKVESETQIPEWLRKNAGWWAQGLTSDEEFAQSIQFMIVNGIIRI